MILSAITSRRAARALAPDPIPEEDIEEIVLAGTLAPSCYNNQPWRIIAVTEATMLENVREALAPGNAWAKKAPLILVLATRPCDDCRLDEGRDYAHFDLGLCAMNIMLQATHLGYVAHPIAGFTPKKVRQKLSIPLDYDIVTLIIIGKKGTPDNLEPWQQAAETAPRERKPISEVVFYNTWGKN
ncbi:MAG TPA: nitroreductase family protein [Spirochaetia bacterium]|nr:nitroreductase family protein [Spirochaetales bacterium]HRS65233.1 nitroreductase family protein [Spirochaetia bacterium]HOT58590.1 nitroreductase family protein [Spirochaetales bacterium]HPD80233.1 nitroreductase family protein [Spirochaetales bacterium]HQK34365.1 nitroreductase family protein [Spirochaetales bacterium]